MRFILGLLIGVGIGFAAAILFAPEKTEAEAERGPSGPSANGVNGANGFKSAFDGLRKQFDEAFTEAKKAQRDAEEEMTERYRKVVGR